MIRSTGAKDAIKIWKENSDFFLHIPILSDKSVQYQAWLLETVIVCQMFIYIHIYIYRHTHIYIKLYCSEKTLWKKIMVQSYGQSHRRFSYLGKERLASMTFFSDMELYRSISRNSKSDTCIKLLIYSWLLFSWHMFTWLKENIFWMNMFHKLVLNIPWDILVKSCSLYGANVPN